ncbi:MAG: hypothetical protein J5903_01370, partial [Clostridia bacterium]|nr:hypothetical protein [Clostridia bacterium]
MKFKELKKSLSVEISPVYLVSGEDAFFRERALKLICERCVKEPDINLTVYNGADVKEDPEKLLSALFSFPFMSEKRVVAVREYYPTSANFAPLRPYFEDPQETTVFVVVNSASCDVLSKQKGITPVDCSKGDLSLLGGWVSNEAAKAGLAITPRAAANLIDLCDYDMTRINGETEKLISYAADKGEITEDDVSEICVKETD